MPTPVLINGQAHDWASVVLTVLGQPVYGVTAIKYEDKQDLVDNYGAGTFPVSRGRGRVETTASITLASEELLALQKAAPNKRIQNIPAFDVIVTYLPADSVNQTTDVLKNCQFKNNGRDIKEGDTKAEMEIELIVSHIEWDA